MRKLILIATSLLLFGCAAPASTRLAPSPATAPPSAQASTAASSDPCHQGKTTYCVLNPKVTQATINKTICVSGWAKSIQPSQSYTQQLKRDQMAAEHLSGPPTSYQEDSRMPVSLGGSPTAMDNFSPEAFPHSDVKDKDDKGFPAKVCAHQWTLLQAQKAMVAKWLSPWPGFKTP